MWRSVVPDIVATDAAVTVTNHSTTSDTVGFASSGANAFGFSVTSETAVETITTTVAAAENVTVSAGDAAFSITVPAVSFDDSSITVLHTKASGEEVSSAKRVS